MPDNSKSTTSHEERSARKPYLTPQLRVYGNIREITQGLGANRTMDGQGGGAKGFKSLP
jgi:hypothetical protein